MRIIQIHVYQHDLPVKGPAYRMALSEVAVLDTTIVEIVTDAGIYGYGETCPLGPTYQPQHARGARAALDEISPYLIGLNPLHIETVSRQMNVMLDGHLYAKAAIDIALWDIAGKAHSMRICDLLGGAVRERVPSYYAIGPESPDEAARQAKEKQKQGFPRIQMKVGGRDSEVDIEAIRKVSATLQPGVRLAADANRSWTVRDTILISQACRDLPLVLEQPCNSFEEISRLKGRVCHPVYMDESIVDVNAAISAIGDDVADGFGLKTTRVGGISAMRTIRDICHVRGLPHTCDDSWGGDIIAAACLHIGATVDPKLLEGVWIAQPYIDENYDKGGGIVVDQGWLNLPAKPGLGIEPDVSLWGEFWKSYS
jgi:4-hydroxyproline betaine 2-epimerase